MDIARDIGVQDLDCVIAILYSPPVEPVATDVTVKATKTLISPDEGTA